MANSASHQQPANRLSALLASVELALVAVSTLAMAAIMLIVVSDVVLRYVFNAPLIWSYDLIGLYLVGTVVFLALSDTLQHHGHIALDVFLPAMPRFARHLMQSVGFVFSAVVVALIAWLEYGQAVGAYLGNERINSVPPMPTWVAHAVLALGMAVLSLRCAYRAIFHLASAFSGRDLVELPPPPITSTRSGEHAE
ncbi:TRAP transporter small permease [Chelativorans sp. AA-79]|uniref:TRAP transporter small permease n=1 Tax=Chelativorans sp. AA-79 TaxID=3028735 RepID=UPI0023F6E5CA|nr:TRAP transporter small permease [Chelativorans sp. AA-79]WEX09671.1 TRAP transporter small permease [Chelativorans sp. AA-79]